MCSQKKKKPFTRVFGGIRDEQCYSSRFGMVGTSEYLLYTLYLITSLPHAIFLDLNL